MKIIWDWNGTLLDDSEACVGALNELLARRGLAPLTLEYYRGNFAFPARDFYAKIGIRLESEDWDALAKEYHDAYLVRKAELSAGAIEALEFAEKSGARQFILSAMHTGYLKRAVELRGISGRFEKIVGTDNLDGGSKLSVALEFARDFGMDDAVVVGDSIHDLEVADAIGAGCVLFAGGSHSRERLEGLAPVAETLPYAAALAVRIARNRSIQKGLSAAGRGENPFRRRSTTELQP